jgi:hypothetical protein
VDFIALHGYKHNSCHIDYDHEKEQKIGDARRPRLIGKSGYEYREYISVDDKKRKGVIGWVFIRSGYGRYRRTNGKPRS